MPPFDSDPANLEFTPEQLRRMTDAALERIIEHIASLDEQPVRGDVDAAILCRALREPPPEAPEDLEPLLDRLFHEWVPRSFNTAAPGYLAYIPAGGVFPGALADFIAGTTNRFTGVWQAAPALVQLEANALDWLRDWMQFPATTRGLFTVGGSMANLNGIVCARERYLGPDIRGLDEAVNWIRGAEGIAVLAHPGRYEIGATNLAALLGEFKDLGGAASEVVNGSHAPRQSAEFARHAAAFGLLASSGSDFHGPGESYFELGRMPELPPGCVPVWGPAGLAH